VGVNIEFLRPVEFHRMKQPLPHSLKSVCLVAPVAAPDLVGLAEPSSDTSSLKAFPTAEGFGAYARGGRWGRVIEVTHLNDSGEGSLRSGMEASGPRICVIQQRRELSE
jgi:hypothetical protein